VSFAAKLYGGDMDLKNLSITEVETGINKTISSKTEPKILLSENTNALIDVYGFMICYKIKTLDLIAYVEGGNIFSHKHVAAVEKYCSQEIV
jgi:hypothetical protein